MITKPLSDLDAQKNKYETGLNQCQNEAEKTALKNEFVSELRLYLFEVNNLIKELFSTTITPFQNEVGGYDGLMRKNANANTITKKTKVDFFKEIDDLVNHYVYGSLSDEKKADVHRAIYILKTYYEDTLV